jgi:hypothetical protein
MSGYPLFSSQSSNSSASLFVNPDEHTDRRRGIVKQEGAIRVAPPDSLPAGRVFAALARLSGRSLAALRETPARKAGGNMAVLARALMIDPDPLAALQSNRRAEAAHQLESFAQGCEVAREHAYERMVQHGQERVADAVIRMRHDATGFATAVTEVLAWNHGEIVKGRILIGLGVATANAHGASRQLNVRQAPGKLPRGFRWCCQPRSGQTLPFPHRGRAAPHTPRFTPQNICQL